MTLIEQTYAQAALLSDVRGENQEQMLQILCQAAVKQLTARLRPGLTPEDCKADFVAAARLYALAALSEIDDVSQLQRMQLGDVTLQRSGDNAAAKCLRNQAELMMGPYLLGRFSFRGV